jgi:PRTRC genetic system protein E
MNLFQELSPILKDCSLKMIITMKDGQISTVIHSYNEKVDDAAIPPIMIRGTAEELDSRFIGAIKAPLIKTAEYFSNAAIVAEEIEKKKEEGKTTKSSTKGGKAAPAKTTTEAPKKPTEPDLFAGGLPSTEPAIPVKTALPKQDIKPSGAFEQQVKEPAPANVDVSTGEIKDAGAGKSTDTPPNAGAEDW